MTTTIETVSRSAEASRTETLKEYREILGRNEKPLKGDADALRKCMATLGIDSDRLAKDLKIVKEAIRLEKAAADASDAELAKERTAAFKKYEDYEEETKQIVEDRKAEGRRLKVAWDSLRDRITRAGDRQRELNGLKRRHADLFCVEPPKPEPVAFCTGTPGYPYGA